MRCSDSKHRFGSIANRHQTWFGRLLTRKLSRAAAIASTGQSSTPQSPRSAKEVAAAAEAEELKALVKQQDGEPSAELVAKLVQARLAAQGDSLLGGRGDRRIKLGWILIDGLQEIGA